MGEEITKLWSSWRLWKYSGEVSLLAWFLYCFVGISFLVQLQTV